MAVIDIVFAGGAVQTNAPGVMTPSSPGPGGTITVNDDTGYPLSGRFPVKLNRGVDDEEHVLIASRVGTVFTVEQRGYDGTNAQAHDNPTVELYFDAESANKMVEHVDDLEADPHSTKLLNNARHDITARHVYGAALGTRPTPVSVGTANAAGSGSNPAAGDHVHDIGVGAIDAANLFGSGVVDQAAIGPNAVGTSELIDANVTTAKIADANVTAAKFAAAVYGASATTVALTSTAGVATTVSRSDHAHAAYALSHLAAPVRRSLNQTGMGPAMQDFTGLSITATVGSNRRIRVRGHAYVQGNDASANYSGVIREGSTTLGKFGWFRAHTAAESAVLEGSVILDSPSAGSHTYKLSMESSGGSNFELLGATDTAWIEVIDEGPA